ncbi:MAG TPA: 4-hydroxy-tetrahydrodipicolinate reductase [Bacteroidetes bacterium]|nr:4-hydroxy-tetrahydrodipicolinate reductase [Bacteroidota bacterium]
MKIALIGYGKMGKEIKALAENRGHTFPLVIDIDNQEDLTPENLKQADVAIEFTSPDAALQNINTCFDAHLPVVSGTTGWTSYMDEVKERCEVEKQAFFYASNYSLGVNILFHINRLLADIMNRHSDYDVMLEETHHVQKLDSPSGTAITLAEDILYRIDRKKTWVNRQAENGEELPIISYRRDMVPGIHTVRYDSEMDTLELTHSAKSRKGFALGAVLAAEFIVGKTGCFSMKDLLSF